MSRSECSVSLHRDSKIFHRRQYELRSHGYRPGSRRPMMSHFKPVSMTNRTTTWIMFTQR